MAGKVSKKDAGYAPGLPHCGVCKHYSEGAGERGSCELVAGSIADDMWCKLFEPMRQRTIAEGKSE
jgi:hypothetical protein